MSKRALRRLGKVSLAGIFGAGTAVGWQSFRRFTASRALSPAPVPAAIDASRETFDLMSSGTMNVYADRGGAGRPLVLLHGVHAGASAMEVLPFFSAYRGTRPVFAPDLPGFGASDRHDRVYSPALYTFALMQMLDRIATNDVPADVIALGLSSEFAARAARDRPDLFNSLTLVSPTGFTASAPSTPRMPSRVRPRKSVRRIVERLFAGPVEPALERYTQLVASQPGARHAVAFLSRGALHTPHVADLVYEKVTVPTLVVHHHAPDGEFARLEAFVERHPTWRSRRIAPTRGLPHFEMPEETFQAVDTLWREVAHAAGPVERISSSGFPHVTPSLR